MKRNSIRRNRKKIDRKELNLLLRILNSELELKRPKKILKFLMTMKMMMIRMEKNQAIFISLLRNYRLLNRKRKRKLRHCCRSMMKMKNKKMKMKMKMKSDINLF